MSSLDALRSICYECEKNMAINKTRCPFRSISNEFCKEYELIKKDLEILEIIKKWSFIQESYKEGYGPYTKFHCIIHTIETEEDFEKIKEWLN